MRSLSLAVSPFSAILKRQNETPMLTDHSVHVLMPNFFNGPGLSEEEFQNGKIMEFITSKGPPPVKAQEALDLGKALKAEGKTSVGLYGLCWGGKVVTLVGSKDDSPFSGVASIHPAMVEPTDFQSLKQPIGFFPSADEPTDAVNKSWEVIKGTPVAGKSVFKHYTDQHHGFAGARAKLGEASNVAAFEDLYRRLGDFFKNVTN